MNTKASVLNAKPFIWIALLAACGVLSAPVQAKSHEVTVRITVSTAGLDLNHPAGAREAYAGLQKAAGIACSHGMRVDLQPPASFTGCYEKALGDAIRSANVPRLTQVYLETHSPREAAACGIELPVTSEEVIRRHAKLSGIPVSRIIEIPQIIDPLTANN